MQLQDQISTPGPAGVGFSGKACGPCLSGLGFESWRWRSLGRHPVYTAGYPGSQLGCPALEMDKPGPTPKFFSIKKKNYSNVRVMSTIF